MNDQQIQLEQLAARIDYLLLVKVYSSWGNLDRIRDSCQRLSLTLGALSKTKVAAEIRRLRDSVSFLEDRAEEQLSPMERVRICRSRQRFTLRDILENVYDDYTALGEGAGAATDAVMICAKATINRLIDNKPYAASVMVIGHKARHGVESRSGGWCTPGDHEKALRYMKAAETEGLPIHLYIFTPGCSPVEEGHGAAQQIARNIYAMAKLRVPMISMISEGVSAGAEAIGLSDFRLMVSHGYYTAVSPEEAAAMEGKICEGEEVPQELIEVCADRLKLTAEDNLSLGTIDRIICEPRLGARSNDYTFLARIKAEMVRATDGVILSVKSLNTLRKFGRSSKKHTRAMTNDHQPIAWTLKESEIRRLLRHRLKKYLEMGRGGCTGRAEPAEDMLKRVKAHGGKVYHSLRHEILRNQRQVRKVIDGVVAEHSFVSKPITAVRDLLIKKEKKRPQRLIAYTGAGVQQKYPSNRVDPLELTDTYTSPLENADRTVSCPQADWNHCLDHWIPDLYSDFSGVCKTCGHHFPLDYQWYLDNIFDPGSVSHFNEGICSGNPLCYTGFNDRLQNAKDKTGRLSGNMTFRARILGIRVIVSMLYSAFRNGTVGCAEGEKFIQACFLAKREKCPFLVLIQTSGGLRIQEGTLAIAQMPRCTMAVREYIEAGGLYLVIHDNNSYGEPLASFLGCTPYQFAVKSSRIGFAGPRAIREAIGRETPPDYHSAANALSRGHIQGIWDRRELRNNLGGELRILVNSSSGQAKRLYPSLEHFDLESRQD